MAKFKPGDKVTWQHHNGSYSNEVIDYIVPPNGYAFRDGGIGAESEIRAGWVPESQTGRANMPPLNSRACNGVPSAQLKKAYDEWKKAAEKFKKWFGAGRRLSERIPAGADESRKMVDFSDLFFKETGRRPPNGYGDMTLEQMLASNSQTCVRSRNAVVAKALNACARNGGIDDFKVGDRVMVRSVVGFTPTDPKPGTVTAIYKSDNRIAVKKDDGGRGLFDASMVTKNACGTARNAVAYDVAAQAGKLFKDAYNALAGCAANLERLTTLGQPDDVPGNDNKIASWAKDKARKVRDLMSKLDQGRL